MDAGKPAPDQVARATDRPNVEVNAITAYADARQCRPEPDMIRRLPKGDEETPCAHADERTKIRHEDEKAKTRGVA